MGNKALTLGASKFRCHPYPEAGHRSLSFHSTRADSRQDFVVFRRKPQNSRIFPFDRWPVNPIGVPHSRSVRRAPDRLISMPVNVDIRIRCIPSQLKVGSLCLCAAGFTTPCRRTKMEFASSGTHVYKYYLKKGGIGSTTLPG